MNSTARTPKTYLAALPDDRRAVVAAVRKVILDNLDSAYEERIQYGMLSYCVPHRVFPDGYHTDPTQPVPFVALAAQKNYFSLYFMGVSVGGDGEKPSAEATWFRKAWERTGKKLNMGKSCVRFKTLEELPLDVIGEAIRRLPAKTYIKRYVETRDSRPRAGKTQRRRSSAQRAASRTAEL